MTWFGCVFSLVNAMDPQWPNLQHLTPIYSNIDNKEMSVQVVHVYALIYIFYNNLMDKCISIIITPISHEETPKTLLPMGVLVAFWLLPCLWRKTPSHYPLWCTLPSLGVGCPLWEPVTFGCLSPTTA